MFFKVLVLVIVLEMTGYEMYIMLELQYNEKERRGAEFVRDKDGVCASVCVRTYVHVTLMSA